MADQITPDMAGCWLDGQYGWQNTVRVVELAQAYGFYVSSMDKAILDHFRQSYDTGDAPVILTLPTGETFHDADVKEAADDLASEATDFLNDHAPEGFFFVWDDGFHLVPESEIHS